MMMRLINAWIFSLSIAVVSSHYAQAETVKLKPQSSCAVATTLDKQQNPIYFLQHQFEGDLQELAIAVLEPNKTFSFKRVTYHQLKDPSCHYSALLIAEGGGWGWHIAWVNAKNLYYTRMDGEAWITPPIKTLAEKIKPSDGLILLQTDKKMWLIWQEQEQGKNNVFAVYSNDEGRFWKDAKLLVQTSTALHDFKISVKETMPYLIWQGEQNGVSLGAW